MAFCGKNAKRDLVGPGRRPVAGRAAVAARSAWMVRAGIDAWHLAERRSHDVEEGRC
jgi:hypothetical protein